MTDIDAIRECDFCDGTEEMVCDMLDGSSQSVPCRCVAAAEVRRLQEQNAALLAEVETLRAFIRRQGYRRCDIPACNCNSFHGGHALRRLMEIDEELGDLTQGTTVLGAVKTLLSERDRLKTKASDICEHDIPADACPTCWKQRIIETTT